MITLLKLKMVISLNVTFQSKLFKLNLKLDEINADLGNLDN